MSWRRTAAAVLSALLAGSMASACGAGSSPQAAAPPTPSASAALSPAPSPTPTAATHTPTPTHAAAVPPFAARVASVTTAELGRSWHSGCPVGAASLRALTLTFWGFDGTAHTGTLVVNASVVPAVTAAFRAIYAARFPIRRIVPTAAYGGDDNASMAADNTSAFNCRYAVSNGPKSWSMHAYGEAIDIDTLENPYTLDGRVYPPAGKPYTDRADVRPGMIVPGSSPVRAFTAVGWGWGGRWADSPDYQHFSTNGK